MKVTKDNAALIYAEAHNAATTATDKYLRETGEHPFNCGFAWVTIKPARGAMVTFLKKSNIGRKAYGGGYQIWNPSSSFTQDMSAKAAGAGEFARVLNKYGITANMGTRMD